MRGFIDTVSDNRRNLSGWIEVAHEDDEPFLRLRRYGRSTRATIQIGPPRKDVVHRLGILNRSFRIDLPEPLGPLDLLSEAVQLEVLLPEAILQIPMSGGGRAAEHSIARTFLGYTDESNRRTSEKGGHPSPQMPSTGGELTAIEFPVGLTSADGSALLGQDGYLFLITESNDLISQYQPTQHAPAAAQLEATTSQWIGLLRSRHAYFAERRIPFIQVLSPEKLTALSALAGLGTSGPTKLYRGILGEIGEEPWVLDGLQSLHRLPKHHLAWHRTDSHHSPRGALNLLQDIFRRLDLPSGHLEDVSFDHALRVSGDLGSRFFGIPLLEDIAAPDPDLWLERDDQVRMNINLGPNGNTQTGSVRHWVNDRPLVKSKILCFGSSSFGAGANPSRMSWWMSRIVSEFMFVWSNTFDTSLVERFAPDAVICQQAERFLPRAPER